MAVEVREIGITLVNEFGDEMQIFFDPEGECDDEMQIFLDPKGEWVFEISGCRWCVSHSDLSSIGDAIKALAERVKSVGEEKEFVKENEGR